MGEMLTRSRIYKIDTHIALTTGEFFDVNDMFDRFSQTNNFRAQREWSKLGGIPANAVIGFMSGLDFFNNVILVPAPQEDELRWEPMPARI
ncbi:hypothetical protein TA05_09790 [Citrobacter rodentium]|nr:hypothetical protein TA05_09790 [Citrobacter rodentium]